MLQAQRVDPRDIQDVGDMIMGTKKQLPSEKFRKCDLCGAMTMIINLGFHDRFPDIEICTECLLALRKIEQYGIDEEDEFIRLEEYVDYKLKDEGMMCPGGWFARLLELKDKAVEMEGIYTGGVSDVIRIDPNLITKGN